MSAASRVQSRHRVLLALLERAPRPMSRPEIAHAAFTVKHETPSHGGEAFYDFVSTPRGPRSFGIEHELTKLERSGHVASSADRWSATPAGVAEASRTDAAIRAEIDAVSARPVLARSFDADTRGALARARGAVHTAGYQSRSVDAFLDELLRAGIGCVIDVRNHPTARRFGFHKSTLARLCAELDIGYVHEPSLGIASSVRAALRTSRERLFEHYTSAILPSASEALERVGDLVVERPSVLVCAETDPADCHRSRLAKLIASRTRLDVVHFGTDAVESP